MMSQATQARCLLTQTCVVTTKFKCKNSYTKLCQRQHKQNVLQHYFVWQRHNSNVKNPTQESTQVKCCTTQTCVEIALTQAIVCG